MALHEDEIPVDVPLVRALLDTQLPALSALPLTTLPEQGSTNALLRLGDELLVRLPRQPGGSSTIDKEARWVGALAGRLPVAVPEVVAVGEPALGYPERWSVVRWIEGRRPAVGSGGVALGRDLASFVLALRGCPVPAGAAVDPELRWYRGEPLRCHDAAFRADLRACRDLGVHLDLRRTEQVWERALALPAAADTRWYHGDLCAENLLVRDGRLAAVLDFGGLSVGDPAVDLGGAWEVLDAAGREAFRAAVGVDDAQWQRGQAWVLAIALMTLPYYGTTMPERCASRLAAAQAVLREAGD